MKRFLSSRATRWVATGLVVAGMGACSTFDSVLEVANPDELNEELLDNPALIDVLVSSVKGDFEDALDDPFIWRGSMITDETLTGINWEQTARLNQRIVQYNEGDADAMFSTISRARAQADSTTGRLRNVLESPGSDVRMARTLNYAGYSYIIMADAMCSATVNSGSEIYAPEQLYQFAVDRFNEALTVAQAAGSDTQANLARVGLTRAHLNLGNDQQVISIADQVPADFRYYAEFTSENPSVHNYLEGTVTGSNHSLGVAPRFVAGGPENFGMQGLEPFLTDPRVQHLPDWRFGHNGSTRLYTPFATLMMSDYNGATIASGGSPATIEQGTDIAFASGLEAQHNKFEAMGATAATLGFVNDRRAFGNQDAVNLSGDALIDELRDQRGRDLFLAGYRLGDIRRWLRQDGDNLFPTGQHPNDAFGAYGDATCYPLPLEEYEGNPNISNPN